MILLVRINTFLLAKFLLLLLLFYCGAQLRLRNFFCLQTFTGLLNLLALFNSLNFFFWFLREIYVRMDPLLFSILPKFLQHNLSLLIIQSKFLLQLFPRFLSQKMSLNRLTCWVFRLCSFLHHFSSSLKIAANKIFP